jgi:hypothetical protein
MRRLALHTREWWSRFPSAGPCSGTRARYFKPRDARACAPPSTAAGRPGAALATRCKRSPRARECRKGARAKARSSVDDASRAASYGGDWRTFARFLTYGPELTSGVARRQAGKPRPSQSSSVTPPAPELGTILAFAGRLRVAAEFIFRKQANLLGRAALCPPEDGPCPGLKHCTPAGRIDLSCSLRAGEEPTRLDIAS